MRSRRCSLKSQCSHFTNPCHLTTTTPVLLPPIPTVWHLNLWPGIWAKTSLTLIPRTTRTLRVWDEFVLVWDAQILQIDVCNSHKFSWKEVALESVFSNYSSYLINGSLSIATFVFVHYKKKTKPILACFITARHWFYGFPLLAAWSMSLKDNFKLPTEII